MTYPRHTVHIRDSHEGGIFVAKEVWLDGRKMLLSEGGFSIEAGPEEVTVVNLRVIASVVRFTGPDEPVEFRIDHDQEVSK